MPAPRRVAGVQLTDRVERLAYTRKQAAEALGVSLATLDRRVVPVIETVATEWGGRLIPVSELERYLAERIEPPRARRKPQSRSGRTPSVPPEVVERIRRERSSGRSLAEIARTLNGERIPTSQHGRQWWPSTVRAVLIRATSGTSVIRGADTRPALRSTHEGA
jgi:hypothetical protein